MKKYFYFAAALLTLASCANDDYVGENEEGTSTQKAISLNLVTPALTRAENTGSDAATALGNQFIVWGEKNESGKTAAEAKNQVFNNYVVNYTASSAYTTTSNTKDWEYVGQTSYADTYVSPTNGTAVAQTIKYWDYGADNYVFTAISALSSEISSGDVKITKNTAGTKDEYEKGYSIAVTTDATIENIYFSDRNKITKGTGTDRTVTNAYGGNVTMKFRNALSKIRVGIYETIPGYNISAIKFYTDGANAANPAFTALDDEAQVSSTSAFGAAVPNSKNGVAGTINVTYYDNTVATTENQPKVTFTPTGDAQNDIILGTNMNTVAAASGLATTNTNPTYDTSGGTYTYVYPQPGNATNMKIKCDYTLTSLDTGEEIKVAGATAEVPAQYLQWQANYTYTYILKISDNTNGSTGGSVTGLYPITLDAVEVVASDGTADYITTVSEPSITTFGVSSGKYVAATDDYAANTVIYATVVEGSSVVTLTEGTNIKLYTVTTTDATNFPITEASVAESLAETSSGTKKISATSTDIGEVVTKVPAEDGKEKTISAFKWTGAASTTYAVEYIKDSKKTYKIVKVN